MIITPKEKTRGIPTKIMTPKKEEPDFSFDWDGCKYIFDNNENIKALGLSLNGDPIAIGIFRPFNEKLNKEEYNNFSNVFKNTDVIGGKQGKCIKKINLDYFDRIKHKFSGKVNIHSELHENNIRIFGNNVGKINAKIKGKEYFDLDLIDFSLLDTEFHPKGKINQYSKTKAKTNPQDLKDYLMMTCSIEKINTLKPEPIKSETSILNRKFKYNG